jgi:LSD1 subclass zinc finger protein
VRPPYLIPFDLAERPPHEVTAVLLICPTCRSGLEVPDGTTAMVRCPACRTIFAPEDSATPEPEEEEEEDEQPRAKARRSAPAEEDEDEEEDRPRKKKAAYRPAEEDEEDEDDEGKEKHRDFDPEPVEDDHKRKRRPHIPDDEMTPAERLARRRAFDRAAWGARLVAVSLGLFMLSMVFVTIFFFQSAFGAPQGWIITIAGFLGLLNWLCAAVGVGLCLSGPRGPGHWGYGIAAATAVLVHFIFLGAVVSQGKEFGIVKPEDAPGNVRWSMLPTRLNATMFYLTAIAYPDQQGVTPKGRMLLSMITGVAEMVRTVLIMMLLSCLARAALDEELAGRCTRTAGIVSGGPGLLALLIFIFVAIMIETNAGLNMFTLILFATVNMGVYSIINGVMFPAYMAALDVTDACEEPFQSLIPNL